MTKTYARYYFDTIQDNVISYQTKRFLEWINKVENIVYNKIHFGLLDLPDEDYMLYFESGCLVTTMAQKIINDFKAYSKFLGIHE